MNNNAERITDFAEERHRTEELMVAMWIQLGCMVIFKAKTPT
ncbi:hypothetical protein [Yersinia enterocolitica]